MADQHDPGAQRTQLALQPLDRRQVEVIGRLVEQQQVRRGGECPRQRRPPGLAAGQPGRCLVSGQAQRLQHRLRTIFLVRVVQPGDHVVEHRAEG